MNNTTATDQKELQETPDTQEILTNQTEFSEEEPIFEEPPTLPPTLEELKKMEEAKLKKKSPKLLIGAAIGIFFVFATAAFFYFAPKQTDVVRKPINGLDTTAAKNQTEMDKRIAELESDLKAADPIKLELPFPLVSNNIFLDEPKRN